MDDIDYIDYEFYVNPEAAPAAGSSTYYVMARYAEATVALEDYAVTLFDEFHGWDEVDEIAYNAWFGLPAGPPAGDEVSEAETVPATEEELTAALAPQVIGMPLLPNPSGAGSEMGDADDEMRGHPAYSDSEESEEDYNDMLQEQVSEAIRLLSAPAQQQMTMSELLSHPGVACLRPYLDSNMSASQMLTALQALAGSPAEGTPDTTAGPPAWSMDVFMQGCDQMDISNLSMEQLNDIGYFRSPYQNVFMAQDSSEDSDDMRYAKRDRRPSPPRDSEQDDQRPVTRGSALAGPSRGSASAGPARGRSRSAPRRPTHDESGYPYSTEHSVGVSAQHVPDWYVRWYPGYSMDVLRHWYSKEYCTKRDETGAIIRTKGGKTKTPEAWDKRAKKQEIITDRKTYRKQVCQCEPFKGHMRRCPMDRPSRSPNHGKTPWNWSHGDDAGNVHDPNKEVPGGGKRITEADRVPMTEEVANTVKENWAKLPNDHRLKEWNRRFHKEAGSPAESSGEAGSPSESSKEAGSPAEAPPAAGTAEDEWIDVASAAGTDRTELNEEWAAEDGSENPFPDGSACWYYSSTAQKWFCTRVLYRHENGKYKLAIKGIADIDQMRQVIHDHGQPEGPPRDPPGPRPGKGSRPPPRPKADSSSSPTPAKRHSSKSPEDTQGRAKVRATAKTDDPEPADPPGPSVTERKKVFAGPSTPMPPATQGDVKDEVRDKPKAAFRGDWTPTLHQPRLTPQPGSARMKAQPKPEAGMRSVRAEEAAKAKEDKGSAGPPAKAAPAATAGTPAESTLSREERFRVLKEFGDQQKLTDDAATDKGHPNPGAESSEEAASSAAGSAGPPAKAAPAALAGPPAKAAPAALAGPAVKAPPAALPTMSVLRVIPLECKLYWQGIDDKGPRQPINPRV
ncbi:MAG: hypothetical protein GY811_07610, partial [Myxococcales bacterium]|nr:hypothetical protein [Myxococcales bacterium]